MVYHVLYPDNIILSVSPASRSDIHEKKEIFVEGKSSVDKDEKI
jgi:hypothetical protein